MSIESQCTSTWPSLVAALAGPQQQFQGAGEGETQQSLAENCCNEASLSYMTCAGPSLQIASLNLTGFGLQGTIPGPIMQQLSPTVFTSLDLSNNLLSGPIPNELGSLSNLQILDVSNNRISGQVPASLAQTQLARLLIFTNRINGSIPQAVATMPSMRFIRADASVLNAPRTSTTSTSTSTLRPTALSSPTLPPPSNPIPPLSAPNSAAATGTSSVGLIVGLVVAGVLSLIVFGGIAIRNHMNANRRQARDEYYGFNSASQNSARKGDHWVG